MHPIPHHSPLFQRCSQLAVMEKPHRFLCTRRICTAILVLLLVPNGSFAFCFLSPACRALSSAVPWIASELRMKEKDSTSTDDGNNNNNNNNAFAGFNPLNYNAAVNRPPSTSASTVISLRQIRMQQITSEMLNNLHPSNESQQTQVLRTILEKHRDFLLEPLEDADAVQDSDSIYLSCRTRAERYRAFDESMTQRLATARDPSVRQVLTALKDFVLACE